MKPTPLFFSVARIFAIGALLTLGARAHALFPGALSVAIKSITF